MNDLSASDPRYATQREHADLDKRVTRLEAGLAHMPAQFHTLTEHVTDVRAQMATLETLMRDLKASREADVSKRDDPNAALAVALHRWIEAQQHEAEERKTARASQMENNLNLAWRAVLLLGAVVLILTGGASVVGTLL